MRNTAGAAQGTLTWSRCRAAGEAGGFITQIETHADGTKLICADTISPLWCDNVDGKWKQVLFSSTTPAGFANRSITNAGNGLRDQGGSTGAIMAPSDSTRWYIVQEAIILVVNITDRTAMRLGNGAGCTATMSPQTSYKQLANSGQPRICGPYLSVHPTDKNRVMWGHQSGVTMSPDGFATDAGKLASVPASTDTNFGTLVQFDPNNPARAYAHSFGNGLYVSTNANTSSPTFTAVAGSPAYACHMRVGPDGKVWIVEADANGHGTSTSSGGSTFACIWKYDGATGGKLAAQPALPIHDIAIDPANANRVFAIGEGSFCASTSNAGNAWSQPWYADYGIYFRSYDVTYFDGGNNKQGRNIGAVQFDKSGTNLLRCTTGEGTFTTTYTVDQTVTWVSQSAGIWQLIPYSCVSHVGFGAVFGNQDRPCFPANNGLDAQGVEVPFFGFNHLWHMAPSRANPGYTVANCNYTGNGLPNESGWTDDNFVTFTHFPSQPYSAGYGGGAMAVSASKDRIICAPGENRVAVYTLNRGNSWQELIFPGIPSGSSAGQYSYYFVRQIVAPDAVDADEFIYYHPGVQSNGAVGNPANAGYFRVQLPSTGPVVSRLTTGFSQPNNQGGQAAGQAWLEPIPGRAGEYVFAADSDFQGLPLLIVKVNKTNNTATVTQVTRVTRCLSIDFGAPVPGGTQAACWLFGYVDGVYGCWYTTDYPDNSATWRPFTTVPLNDFTGYPGLIHADRNEFGLVYAGVSGKGWVYARLTDGRAVI